MVFGTVNCTVGVFWSEERVLVLDGLLCRLLPFRHPGFFDLEPTDKIINMALVHHLRFWSVNLKFILPT